MKYEVGLWTLGCVSVFAVGCSDGALMEEELTGQRTDPIIIGDNDLVSVAADGSNVPERFRGLLDGFGRARIGTSAVCTATHVGGGIAVTAGHCFGAALERRDDLPCPANTFVDWGFRGGQVALVSSCERVLANRDFGGNDYTIFRVSPAPAVSVPVRLDGRAGVGAPLTIFSHPQGRSLEWSQSCTLALLRGSDELQYECDTEGGSSGAPVIDDVTGEVVAFHWGATGGLNAALFADATPLAEILAAEPEPEPEPEPPVGNDDLVGGGLYRIVARHSGSCVDVAFGGTVNGTNLEQLACDGSTDQVFRAVELGGGSYRFVHQESGKCVELNEGSDIDGANFQLWTCDGSPDQAFAIQSVASSAFYRLVNWTTNKCVEVAAGVSTDRANVFQWECLGDDRLHQQFTFQLVGAVSLDVDCSSEATWNAATGWYEYTAGDVREHQGELYRCDDVAWCSFAPDTLEGDLGWFWLGTCK